MKINQNMSAVLTNKQLLRNENSLAASDLADRGRRAKRGIEHFTENA